MENNQENMQPQGVEIQPQYVIQSLQRQVSTLTFTVAQQDALINQLQDQLNEKDADKEDDKLQLKVTPKTQQNNKK